MPPAFSADKTLTRARAAAKAQNWAEAAALYQSVLQRFPANARARQGLEALKPQAVPALLKTAQAQQAKGLWAEAEESLATAFALAPELPQIGLALGACQLETGRAHPALMTAEAVLKRDPANIEALNVKGRALRELGRGEDAFECLDRALGLAPDSAQTLNNLGILLRAQGDKARAIDFFRRAIAQMPGDATLHRNLAQSMKYTAGDPHIDQMRARLAAMGANDPAAAPLHFALFKAFDDLGDGEHAFSHLETANRLTKAALGYDFQSDAIPYAVTKSLFKTPVPEAEGPTAFRPIFITGLPRTGTTLAERILSRAEGVQTCGELTVVQVATGALLRRVMAREDKALRAADIQDLRHDILAGLAPYSDQSPVLVDKMPLNFRWIGYILAALPEARVVHLSRDPVAVAWSLYRHSFSGAGNGFVYDPADIARFMVMHRDLMAHWHALYPGRIFELDYAALVDDPETTTRALAKATGLSWTPDWLSPEQASGQVLTASAEQVRRAIYRGSDAEWKRYEGHLAPLLTALETAGVV